MRREIAPSAASEGRQGIRGSAPGRSALFQTKRRRGRNRSSSALVRLAEMKISGRRPSHPGRKGKNGGTRPSKSQQHLRRRGRGNFPARTQVRPREHLGPEYRRRGETKNHLRIRV